MKQLNQITVIQKRIEPGYSDPVYQALQREKQVIVLPEYFNFGQSWTDIDKAVKAGLDELHYLGQISARYQSMIIAGSIVERDENTGYYHNRSHVLANGEDLGFFTKLNLFGDEQNILRAGEDVVLIDTPLGLISILICADVLIPGIFAKIRDAAKGEKIAAIFCPTTSPRKEENEEVRKQRDRDIYGKGAEICQAPIYKSCAVGEIRGHAIQGRSLIAFPDGNIINSKDIDLEEILEIPL